MRIPLTLLLSLGLFFLPAHLGAQVEAPEMPEAPEPGEVQIPAAQFLNAQNPVTFVLEQFNNPAVQEVEIRDLPRQTLNDATTLLIGIATATPGGLPAGAKADFRTTAGQRFRIQNEEGELRARFEGFTLTLPAGMTAEAFAQGIATAGNFARVRFRELVVGGQRLRVEVRNGVVEVRPDRRGRGQEGTSREISGGHSQGKDLPHEIRGTDRADLERDRQQREQQADRDRGGRDRSGRSERLDRHERSGRH